MLKIVNGFEAEHKIIDRPAAGAVNLSRGGLCFTAQ
jgi:hypothetical protein